MIFDKIENLSRYSLLDKNFNKIIEFISKKNLNDIEDGKYIIEEENLYVNIETYNTKREQEGKLEAHRKYIDLQYIIKGQERFAICDIQDIEKVIEEYNSERDIIFFASKAKQFIEARSGEFLIFDENCVHMPQFRIKDDISDKVKKAVFKIKI